MNTKRNAQNDAKSRVTHRAISFVVYQRNKDENIKTMFRYNA